MNVYLFIDSILYRPTYYLVIFIYLTFWLKMTTGWLICEIFVDFLTRLIHSNNPNMEAALRWCNASSADVSITTIDNEIFSIEKVGHFGFATSGFPYSHSSDGTRWGNQRPAPTSHRRPHAEARRVSIMWLWFFVSLSIRCGVCVVIRCRF